MSQKHDRRKIRASRAATIAALALSAVLLKGMEAKAWEWLNITSGTRELDIAGSDVSHDISQSSFYDGGAVLLSGAGTRLHFYGNGDLKFHDSISKSGKGGAIAVLSGAALSIDIDGVLRFADNFAHTRGGALFFQNSSGCLSAKDIIFSGNSNSTGYNYGDKNGGALTLEKASVALVAENDIAFRHNSAGGNSKGGALFADDNSSVTFSAKNVKFESNSTETGWGGALRINKSSVVSIDAENDFSVVGNLSVGNGGGVHVDNSTLRVAANTICFADNSSPVGGDDTLIGVGGGSRGINFGIQTYLARESITFSGNRAGHHGGGLLVDRGAQTELYASGDIVFMNNSADVFGGGVATHFLNSYAEMSAKVSVQSDANILFIANASGARDGTTDNGGGGAVFIDKNDTGTFAADGDIVFRDNYAANNAEITRGGAISVAGVVSFDAGGSLTFDGNFINSIESGQGGAIAVVSGGSLDLGEERTKNVVFANNHVSGDKADDSIVLQGGAIFIEEGSLRVAATEKIVLKDNYAHSCHALAQGGAIYVGADDVRALLTLTAPEIEFSGNHVEAAHDDDDGHTAKGGALYNHNGHISIAADALSVT